MTTLYNYTEQKRLHRSRLCVGAAQGLAHFLSSSLAINPSVFSFLLPSFLFFCCCRNCLLWTERSIQHLTPRSKGQQKRIKNMKYSQLCFEKFTEYLVEARIKVCVRTGISHGATKKSCESSYFQKSKSLHRVIRMLINIRTCSYTALIRNILRCDLLWHKIYLG